MIKRYSDSGRSWWHEPPYTKEEEDELAHAINAPPVTVARVPSQPAPKHNQQSPEESPSQD
jgi:hypothetical protein